jgi:hypothetical protein
MSPQIETTTIPHPTMPTAARSIHIKMMDAILRHRLGQIELLSRNRVYFDYFVSRLSSISAADGTTSGGHYSEYLLTRPGNVEEVGRHYIALMYRSVDERLSSEKRLNAVQCVRKTSRLLMNVLAKMKRGDRLDDAENSHEEQRQNIVQKRSRDVLADSKNDQTIENTSTHNVTKKDAETADLVSPPETSQASHENIDTSKPDGIIPPTSTIKQLPPSPPPVTKVLEPFPEPFPDPRPFTQTRTAAFLADKIRPFFSASLYPRLSNHFSYNSGYYLDGSGACLDHKTHLAVRERLSTWDPYWKIAEDLGLRSVKSSSQGNTWVGTRTTACVPTKDMVMTSSSVSSCATLTLNLPNADKNLLGCVKWGQLATPDPSKSRQRDQYKTGDTRLILRTLPLFRSVNDIKKRADTHIWPKGTSVQLNDDTFLSIAQRKQEKHDEKSWKGMSHMLDLTSHVNPKHPLHVKMCCAEVVENVDHVLFSPNESTHLTGSYALHAAICKYVSPSVLYDMLMGKTSGGDVLIPTLSERSAKIIAMEYVASQTVALEDSDDEDMTTTAVEKNNSLTLSLVDPVTKKPIETPVRGRNCKVC